MSKHIPVLLSRLIEKVVIKPGGMYVDATFGEGHYSRALLDLGARVIATDADPNAFERSKSIQSSNFTFHSSRFGNLMDHVKEPVDGLLFDIGISSNQLDDNRGFSFLDSTLDMRMNPKSPNSIPAHTLINNFSEELLASIIFDYGEERKSRKIAREICAYRSKKEIQSAQELSDVITRCVGFAGKNPSTKTFQALRIYVNDELNELYRGLCAAEKLVKPGGFIAVVSFHSLEDRTVKSFFKFCEGKRMDLLEDYPFDEFTPSIAKSIGPYAPLEDELKNNIRSRSGKLRIAFKSDAPSQGHLLSDVNLWRKDKSREMRQMMRMLCATMSASIQVLLEAEKEALKVVQKAKAYRVQRLKDARTEAITEITSLKAQKQQEYQAYEKSLSKDDGEIDFSDKITEMQGQYEKNKQQVLDKLLTQVVRVVPTIHPNVLMLAKDVITDSTGISFALFESTCRIVVEDNQAISMTYRDESVCDDIIKSINQLELQDAIIILINSLSARIKSQRIVEKELQGLDVMFDAQTGDLGWTNREGLSFVARVGKEYGVTYGLKLVSSHGLKGECMMSTFERRPFGSIRELIDTCN